jgi:hypothetical protein
MGLAPQEAKELEAFGERWADYFESEFEPELAAQAPVPPEALLRQAAYAAAHAQGRVARAVDMAREAGLSWHKIGLVLDLTAEGARRRYGRKAA